jgi:hypothetical protein
LLALTRSPRFDPVVAVDGNDVQLMLIALACGSMRLQHELERYNSIVQLKVRSGRQRTACSGAGNRRASETTARCYRQCRLGSGGDGPAYRETPDWSKTLRFRDGNDCPKVRTPIASCPRLAPVTTIAWRAA